MFKEGVIAPNDMRELRGPAAADVRIVNDLNGWSPSAPRKGSAAYWPWLTLKILPSSFAISATATPPIMDGASEPDTVQMTFVSVAR